VYIKLCLAESNYIRNVLAASFCMSVCNTITVESLDVGSLFLVCEYIFKFVYEIYRVKVKATGTKKRVCVTWGESKAKLASGKGTADPANDFLSDIRQTGL